MSASQNEDPGLEKLREEYLKQLMDRYEARSKTFRTLLFGLLGFGAMFLLLVLVPFSSLRRHHHKVSEQLGPLQDQAGQLALAVEAYGKAAQGFGNLRSSIDRAAGELRDALPGISRAVELSPVESNAAFPQQVQQQIPAQGTLAPNACNAAPDREDRMNCHVAAHVRMQFERYSAVLETEVLKPIEALPAGVEGKPNAAKLRSGLEGIQTAFETRLRETPRFWERFSGKIDFYSVLREDLERFWEQSGFRAQEAALATAKKKVDSTLADLKARRTALEDQEKGLSARLADIESPFGKLPVGLIEGVQVFPLLMAIGFAWCWAVLVDLVGMRRALLSGYREAGPDQAMLMDRHLSLIAPLWIGSRNSRTQDSLALLTLFAPIAIFVLGCTVVFYLWSQDAGVGDIAVQNQWLYGALYLLSALGLAVASVKVLGLVSQVRAGAAPVDSEGGSR